MTTTIATTMTTIATPSHQLKACLGIDVSKATLEVCLLRDSAPRHRYRRTFSNSRTGLEALVRWVSTHHSQPVAALMESTGSYGELAAHLLHQAGHRVSVLNARRIQQYAQSQCRHNKTDQVDAEIIARYGFTGVHNELPQWLPAPEPQGQLRELLRRGDELSALLQAERNRIEAAAQKSATLESLRSHIQWLEKELARLEKTAAQLIKASPDLAADCLRLEAIPGIGAKTARTLVAELPRHLKDSRTAAAWAGVAPRISESGTIKKPSRIAPGGNRYLRKALYFPALVAIKYNPRFKTFAERMTQHGLTKMQVICAVIHKLLRTAFAILKNQSAYDPSHCSVIHKNSPNPA
jgi:transposase